MQACVAGCLTGVFKHFREHDVVLQVADEMSRHGGVDDCLEGETAVGDDIRQAQHVRGDFLKEALGKKWQDHPLPGRHMRAFALAQRREVAATAVK